MRYLFPPSLRFWRILWHNPVYWSASPYEDIEAYQLNLCNICMCLEFSITTHQQKVKQSLFVFYYFFYFARAFWFWEYRPFFGEEGSRYISKTGSVHSQDTHSFLVILIKNKWGMCADKGGRIWPHLELHFKSKWMQDLHFHHNIFFSGPEREDRFGRFPNGTTNSIFWEP